MNDLVTKQNGEYFINLLKAQRIAYSQCKSFHFLDLVSIAIAISFPLLTLQFPDSQKIFNAFGVLWTIAYLITEVYRKNKTTQGAIIQEQFDTDLFNMKWNRILCKEKISIDVVLELGAKYHKNDLINWYSSKIKNSLPQEIGIILCQRINFSWEISQRRKFVIFLTLAVAIYYLIYIAMGIYYNIGFFSLLLILSPSISFLLYGVLNILSFRSHVKSKNDTLKFIDEELEAYTKNGALPVEETLRQIQDKIFNERTVPEKVPDWFYRMRKSKNENFIDELVTKIQNNL